MLALIVRYGIVALAAALAALNGGEASGAAKRNAESRMLQMVSGQWTGRSARIPPSAFRLPPEFHRPPIAVPPGTLGLTYHQISRLVPEDEHPRTGMIDIHSVPAGVQVKIAGMEGHRAPNGVWHFRTVRPLLPCLSTVRTAYLHSPLGGPLAGANYRAFRLIPGRIVTLHW